MKFINKFCFILLLSISSTIFAMDDPFNFLTHEQLENLNIDIDANILALEINKDAIIADYRAAGTAPYKAVDEYYKQLEKFQKAKDNVKKSLWNRAGQSMIQNMLKKYGEK
jgi:hypothetical protein